MNSEQAELDELEFEQPLEEDIEHIETFTAERRVYADQGDPEIESLYGKYKRGKLVVQSDFQRYFVWDTKKSSRLIESVLLDIPLPVIYLAEEQDGKEYVIDGQQRLTSFFSFIDGKLPNDTKDFQLVGLQVFNELNRKRFKDIDEAFQDKVRYCKIRTITFRKESDPNLKFEIFERLNTGSVSLNDQELRNCIYRGKYNNLLKSLAQDEDFKHLLGVKNTEKRMRDVELVLRFAAFYHATYLKYKPPIKTFLNKDMERHQFITEKDAEDLKNAFKNAVAIILSLLGKHAFKRFYKGTAKNPDGYWEPKKFNSSLYDVLMYTFSKTQKHAVYQHLDTIRESLIHLMANDREFIEAIELSTSSIQAVTKRFDKLRLTVQDIIGIARKEPRCFSLALKEELFETNPTCTICQQRIQHLDDAAIDHIEQYWQGGKTIPENARLSHRYCNWSRSRDD